MSLIVGLSHSCLLGAFRTLNTGDCILVIERFHTLRVIAFSGRRSQWKRLFQLAHFLGSEMQLECLQILFKVAKLFCARFRDNILSFGQHPAQSHLRGSTSLFIRHLLDSFKENQIALKVVSLKTRVMMTPILR
jgi:hypothetical protein